MCTPLTATGHRFVLTVARQTGAELANAEAGGLDAATLGKSGERRLNAT
jgi:hypothetical protein